MLRCARCGDAVLRGMLVASHPVLQGEDRAQLNLASMEASTKIKLNKSDMILYSAKVIPGNDKRVMKMFNRISNLGPKVSANRADGLHTRCPPTSQSQRKPSLVTSFYVHSMLMCSLSLNPRNRLLGCKGVGCKVVV